MTRTGSALFIAIADSILPLAIGILIFHTRDCQLFRKPSLLTIFQTIHYSEQNCPSKEKLQPFPHKHLQWPAKLALASSFSA